MVYYVSGARLHLLKICNTSVTVSIWNLKELRFREMWLVQDQTMMEENANQFVSPAKPPSFPLDSTTLPPYTQVLKPFFPSEKCQEVPEDV